VKFKLLWLILLLLRRIRSHLNDMRLSLHNIICDFFTCSCLFNRHLEGVALGAAAGGGGREPGRAATSSRVVSNQHATSVAALGARAGGAPPTTAPGHDERLGDSPQPLAFPPDFLRLMRQHASMMTTAITAVNDSGGGGGGGGGGSRGGGNRGGGGGDGSGSATAASGVRPSHVERNAFTSAVSGRIDRDVAATELAVAYARCLRVLDSVSQTDVVVLNGTDGGVERGADAATLTTVCRLAAVHDVTVAQERALENACIALTRCVSKDTDADDCVTRGATLAESSVGDLALALSLSDVADNDGDDRHTEGATAAQSRDGRDVGLRQARATDGVWLPLSEIGPGALARAEEITARAGAFGVSNKWYGPPPPPPPPDPPDARKAACASLGYALGLVPSLAAPKTVHV
jgi:hypothetical protein